MHSQYCATTTSPCPPRVYFELQASVGLALVGREGPTSGLSCPASVFTTMRLHWSCLWCGVGVPGPLRPAPPPSMHCLPKSLSLSAHHAIAHAAWLTALGPPRSCTHHLLPCTPWCCLDPVSWAEGDEGLLGSQGSHLGGRQSALLAQVPKQQALGPPPPGINPGLTNISGRVGNCIK